MCQASERCGPCKSIPRNIVVTFHKYALLLLHRPRLYFRFWCEADNILFALDNLCCPDWGFEQSREYHRISHVHQTSPPTAKCFSNYTHLHACGVQFLFRQAGSPRNLIRGISTCAGIPTNSNYPTRSTRRSQIICFPSFLGFLRTSRHLSLFPRVYGRRWTVDPLRGPGFKTVKTE